MTEKIAWVVHPVTAEQKQELRNKGFKILDAQFAPEGAEIIDLNKPAKPAKEAEKAGK